MTYAPILFISAMTGQRVDRLFELIDYVSNQAAIRITTGMLNTVLADAQTRVQPPTDKGRRLKIYYMTQVGIAAAPLRGVLQRRAAVPLLLSAVSGKLHPHHLRPGGHAHHPVHPAEGRQGGVTHAEPVSERRCRLAAAAGC